MEKDQSFVLKVIQPGLVGLMDGSVSTLAPLFATAFVSRDAHTAFLIGLSAATGAGISMAFAEALSDNGVMTGRGHPVARGLITGAMTFLGGMLHTLPFLMSDIHAALTYSYAIVVIELFLISYIRYRFFKTNFFVSVIQVVVGGALVFLAGYLIGSA